MASTNQRNSIHSLFWIVLCIFGATLVPEKLSAQEANYDESKMPNFTLPNILVAADGSPIIDANQWQQRRAELLGLFETHMFGKRPDSAFEQEYSVRTLSNETFGKDVVVLEVTILLTCEDRKQSLPVLIFLPKSETPVPMFVGPNFHGNHAVSSQPDVSLPIGWVPKWNGSEDNKATAEQRGQTSSRWPIREILSAGFGVATVYSGDIDADYDDQFQGGVHQLLGGERNQSDWGTISAWAWGMSRVMDFLESDDRFDSQRVTVIGHSRLGKTALWAGATDARFAAVISNNSGCGGAALSRRRIGESVRRINTSFPHWFNTKFKTYNDNEDQCPVDQHMLIALMAPRPVYIASASEDHWADPKGEFLSGVFATPVYQLLGKEGLAITEFPQPETPCHSVIGHHLRAGKHDITLYDWQQYIAFVKQHLNVK